MKDLPEWIPQIIERDNLDCHICKKRFVPSNLTSLGVQRGSKEPYNDCLAMGLFCKECNQLSLFEIREMTLTDMAFMILDAQADSSIKSKEDALDEETYENRKGPNAHQRSQFRGKTKSKITLQEIRQAKLYLQSIKTHEEFLIAMGMSPSDIEGFRFRRSTDKKDGQ